MYFPPACRKDSGFFPILLCLGSISIAGKAFASVDGTVVDAGTRVPIVNARVKFSSGLGITVTDAQGRFHLASPSQAMRPRPSQAQSSRGVPNRSLLVYGDFPEPGTVAYDARGRRFEFPSQGPALANADIRASGVGIALAKSAAATCLLAVEAAGYLPREANCSEGDTNRIEIASATAGRFFYQVPVQAEDGWTVGEAKDVFTNLKSLTDMMDSLAAKKFKEVHGVLVAKGGKLVLEAYYTGNADSIDFEHGIKRIKKGDIQWSRTQKHYVASCNKSITATIVGMALVKNALTAKPPLTTATPLAQLLPKYEAQFTGEKATITLQDALTMSMGFQWDEWSAPDLANMWGTSDLIAYVLARNMAAAPGAQWVYNSGGPNILLAAMEPLVGDVARFGDTALFAPLGITDYRWEKQPTGQPEGSARMFMRPRDMAKIGELYLQGGVWEGKQVVPAAWVSASTQMQKSAKPKNPNDYGYLWWIRKLTTPKGAMVNYYEAEGDGGQYIAVFPAQDLVVVFTGGNYGDSPTYDGQIGRILAHGILPAIDL